MKFQAYSEISEAVYVFSFIKLACLQRVWPCLAGATPGAGALQDWQGVWTNGASVASVGTWTRVVLSYLPSPHMGEKESLSELLPKLVKTFPCCAGLHLGPPYPLKGRGYLYKKDSSW